MFGSKRSGIPVAASASKSSIPTVKKATNLKSAQASSTRSNLTSPVIKGASSPDRRSPSPKQVSKISDLSNDPKLLKTQIIDLQKKLDNREETLNELSDKLAKKSEEFGDLMDDRDTMRKRNSIDLQQVTKDYMELQDKLREEQIKTSGIEKDFQEEKERLQLELDVSKGEHELELSMLRKEIIDIRNKSQQRGIPLDVETDRLRSNYESEIQSLKEQLQEQIAKNDEAIEKIEQHEFELLEVNEMKKQYQRQIEVIAAEHNAEISKIKLSYDAGSSDESALDVLRKEHESNVKALKEQHNADLEKLQTELVTQEKEMMDKQTALHKDYESRMKTLEAELEQSKSSAAVNEDTLDKLQLKHKEEIETLETFHLEEIQRVRLEQLEQPRPDKDANKSSEIDQEQKRRLEAYEHEMRSLKAELKKERLDFTEAREMLESNLTDMEQEMKAREEKVRWELKEEHKYELENLIEEHEQVLHDKEKAYKHEMSELKKNYEAKREATNDKGAALEQQDETHQKEIEDLKNKYENDLEVLQETLENLQMDHEELQTEYDLVVNDLEGELEMTKIKVKGGRERRRSSGALKEGIGKLRSHNEENVQHLTTELKEAHRIISSLNSEIASLKENEKASIEHLDKVTKLEELVKELEQEGHQHEDHLNELEEWKQSNEKLEHELLEIRILNQNLQTEMDCLKKEKDSEIVALENKIAEATKQSDQLENEKRDIQHQLERGVEKFEIEKEKMQLEKEQKVSSQKQKYEEDISKLESSIRELQSENQMLEVENQQLREEVDDLQIASKSEPHVIANQSFSICAENIDMIGAEVPEPTEELKDDQRMKAIVEDFENKTADLEDQLTKANQELTSKDKRLQSFNVEMNVLRESLDDERIMVQNLEDRCQKILQNRDSEIEKIKKKYESGAEYSVSEQAEREAEIRDDYDNQVESLRNEMKSLNEQNQKLTKETNNLRKEVDVLGQQLVEQDAKNLAESIKQAGEYDNQVGSLRNEMNSLNEQNQKLTNETSNLRREVDVLGQQLVEQDAKHLAESIKQAGEIRETTSELEEELDTLKDRLKSATTTLNKERKEHERKQQETQFLVDQLKQSESNNTRIQELVNELQKLQEENRSLRSELTTKIDNFQQEQEKFQKENRTKSAEIESLTSMIDSERHGHKQKIEHIEKEMDERDNEISTLSEMLEKEQANHEKTIRDTQKHIGKLSDLEVRNDEFNRENVELKMELKETQAKNHSVEREAAKLKAKLRDLKAEVSRKTQDNDDLLNRSKKIAIDEMEQVQKLNRSLTQAEIHKDKLLGEVENSKQELQKTQDKYQKTKGKLKMVTEKWHKDHTKLEGILLSPRVEMGLQTSLIEPEELEDTKNQLSNSMKRNTRLEEELKDSKQGLSEFKNDIQAMKRANNVLIKQNQVLYLETEALKTTVEALTEKADQLRQVSVKLTNDNENLRRENTDLKERLETTELNLSQVEGQKQSFDELNKSSKFELEEQKTTSHKYEQDNALLKDQNEFLLSQAKRLQTKVDELEGDGKQLKNELLTKEVELLKKERALSEVKTQRLESTAMVPVTNPLQGLQRVTSNGSDFQTNAIQSKEPEIKAKAEELSVEAVPFSDSGITPDGSKGYVGLKSYQVIEWDTKQRIEPDNQTKTTPMDSIQLAKIKQLEFDSSNYLGSAYWDTFNLLKNMKSSQ